MFFYALLSFSVSVTSPDGASTLRLINSLLTASNLSCLTEVADESTRREGNDSLCVCMCPVSVVVSDLTFIGIDASPRGVCLSDFGAVIVRSSSVLFIALTSQSKHKSLLRLRRNFSSHHNEFSGTSFSFFVLSVVVVVHTFVNFILAVLVLILSKAFLFCKQKFTKNQR